VKTAVAADYRTGVVTADCEVVVTVAIASDHQSAGKKGENIADQGDSIGDIGMDNMKMDSGTDNSMQDKDNSSR
jgi:hypothetical protein